MKGVGNAAQGEGDRNSTEEKRAAPNSKIKILLLRS